MRAHGLPRWTRQFLPRRAIVAARLLKTFFVDYGHSRHRNGMAITSDGRYLPWLTYPMIEFLDGLDLSSKTVFEFGSGGSTLFWAKRAREVTAVELDGTWAAKVASLAPDNVNVIHEPDGHLYAAVPVRLDKKFDVVLIDGAERFRSTLSAIAVLSDGGMILLDNADWYPNCRKALIDAGLIEIPFCGFDPINSFASVSAAFLRREFSIERKRPTLAIAGKYLAEPVLDDSR
jgi:hypothetical protein